MSKIQELLKDYSGTPCWMCEHRLTKCLTKINDIKVGLKIAI